MAYRIEAIPMTLSDLQDHSPTASLLKCDFLYNFQQLTRFQLTARRAVSL